MRLITFELNGSQKLGAWINGDQQIVDLAAAAEQQHAKADPAFASMQALIEAGPEALDRARALAESPDSGAVLNTADVRILAPLPRPVQFRDTVSFPGHVKGCLATMVDLACAAAPDPAAAREAAVQAGKLEIPPAYYDFPVYYLCNSFAVIGPEAELEWPAFSNFIDYELEWAAVIGKQARNVKRDDARGYIFGYTVFNDWSARDEQIKVSESPVSGGVPSPGKDFANSLGPCIVTADEIADPYALEMQARVNGERVGGGSTGGMHYRFENLIEYLSARHDLYPGEVIGSGTVGSGCSLENRHLVRPGDTIELEVEGIGVLRNRVLAPHIDLGALSFPQALGLAIQRSRQKAA
ncbi:MAG: fumarylacetoacetate hydrolase family protein [Pseudoxanthomonas sp.]